MKLHVYLRNLGVASRRKAEELIADGRVAINGELAHIGQVVKGNEVVEVNGQAYGGASSVQIDSQYILINKPVDYTSTTADFYTNEKSVLELLPYDLRKQVQWQIVGRLDKNSEGLLLLTNNGNVSYLLTHPKFQVEKEYEVVVSRKITESERQKLLHGVTSALGETYQFKSVIETGASTYSCVLTEGKKREIREAFSFFDNHVKKLTRVRLGELHLGNLGSGQYRELSESEVADLQLFVERVSNAVSQELQPGR